jgi:hypothetical protein
MMQRACHVTAVVLNHPAGSTPSARYVGVVTFEVQAVRPNEYRAISVSVDKPGLKARTRTGYYAQS